MIEDLNQVMTSLSAHFNADTSISYVEAVSILDYTSDFPGSFDKYAIVISPRAISFSLKFNQVTQEKDEVYVVCIVRNFDPEKSLTGTEPGEVGIIKMVYDVWHSAGQFLEDNKSSFDVDYTELDSEIDLENKNKERAGFFHEVILPLKIRLKMNRHPKAG